MSTDARAHWDQRYAEAGPPPVGIVPYPLFAAHSELFPTSGAALEVACGRGRGAVWLADRGMAVHAVDVSPVAIKLAEQFADRSGVADRCRFEVHDLDHGLPDGEPVDLVLCYKFRDPALDTPMVERLKPGGLLAVAVLSEVDAAPGRFRAAPGELERAFASLDVLVAHEANGHAFLIGRKPLYAY